MGSKFENDLAKAAERIRKEAEDKAVAVARYRVQEDFNKELPKVLAQRTGHKKLSTTVFAEIALDSVNDLDVDIYTEEAWIYGMFSSKSSFHQSGDKWDVVKSNYGLSKWDFWDKKLSGEFDGDDNHGIVDVEWLTENFWQGKVYSTNGWPLGDAEFLEVYISRELSAEKVVKDYIKAYKSKNKFSKYIQQEVKKFKNKK